MTYSYFYCSGSILFIITTLVFAFLTIAFLLRTARLTQYIKELKKENEKILASYKNNQKNPLGTLFDAGTKSMNLVLNKEGKILQISDSLLNILGYTRKQIFGKNIYGTLLPLLSKKEKLEANLINRLFSNPKLYTEYETTFKTKEGEKIWISWTNRFEYDKKGKAQKVYSVGFDITNRKKLEEQLKFLATADPKTGVLNRYSLLEVGMRELKRTLRHHHDFSALAFRLSVSENTLTIDQENTLVEKIITILKNTIRDTDYLGRVGEDEFVILLPETPVENVPALEKRLLEKLSNYFGKKTSVRISIDFSKYGYTDKIKSIDTLIVMALKGLKSHKKERS